MDAERRQRLVEVIRDEAQRLSQRLDESLTRDADTLRPQWPLEDMLATDLVFALRRSFEATLGVVTRYTGTDEVLWLSVDSYSLVQALTHLMGRVASAYDLREVTLELRAERRLVRLSLRWPGAALEPAKLHEWEDEAFATGSAGHPPTLRAVLERHGSEAWCQTDRLTGENLLSLHLLTSRPEDLPPIVEPVGARPVYYDFDLFNQPGQRPDLDERPLSDLSYTVFDTETTGLAPSDGDEIISIGAVRIVNGRLLKQECFDQLVNPRRSVRKEAQRVHGITAPMLANQPTIEQALPAFHRFAEDTVLVAHGYSIARGQFQTASLDHAVWHLRAAGAVEERERLLQRAEAGAHLVDRRQDTRHVYSGSIESDAPTKQSRSALAARSAGSSERGLSCASTSTWISTNA